MIGAATQTDQVLIGLLLIGGYERGIIQVDKFKKTSMYDNQQLMRHAAAGSLKVFCIKEVFQSVESEMQK